MTAQSKGNLLMLKIPHILAIRHWTYVISDLNGEEIVGTFYEK